MNTTLPALAKLRPNPYWAKLPLFDLKGWRTMAFGEFAESINERVEPSTAAEDIYVGLDDLDSGCLQIQRWGNGSDVIGTKLRFQKGDIIFGRRRAYQRKLAVAEMDGICSAHAMVVRAKPELVLPEFLPFLMMSDRFMNRAVEISVGSLSPTINWTTLKHEPFALPPLDQQRRLAEILWPVDETEQCQRDLCASVTQAISARLRAVFDNKDAKAPLMAIEDVAARKKNAIVDGPFGSNLKSIHYRASGVPVIQSQFVTSGVFRAESYVYVTPEHFQSEIRSKTEPGDVILHAG